ncbi:hypothetical protein [Gorillibacterium sp. sgz500922]|uniref:hypothetical protein n=1 Tax=Gorillibacterium sp. sgz500922 TaxID=3446694 RepID=UPI003F66CA1C
MNHPQDCPAWVEEAWERSLAKTLRNAGRIGASFPHAANGGVYVAAEPGWWTASPPEGLRSLLLAITGFGGHKKAGNAMQRTTKSVAAFPAFSIA